MHFKRNAIVSTLSLPRFRAHSSSVPEGAKCSAGGRREWQGPWTWWKTLINSKAGTLSQPVIWVESSQWLNSNFWLFVYSRSLLQWHLWEWPISVTVSEWLKLCHSNQLNFTLCHSKRCHYKRVHLYYACFFTCGKASRRSISRLSSPSSPSSNRQIMTILSKITMIFLFGVD